jgi:hypothetical protein
MNAHVRRKLDMAGRVRDFSRLHTSEDPSYAVVLTSFESHLDRAEALARQQRGGQITSRTARARRREHRAMLHENLLPYLVRVGEAVARTQPELGQTFELPKSKLANAVYRTAARSMFDQASAARDRFIAAGMTERFLTDLGETLDAFDKAVEESSEARLAHVGARADLEAVTEELMELVALLDGLNRYRFRNNAELTAAWDSARNVVGPSQPKPVEPSPQNPPGDDVVKPAA